MFIRTHTSKLKSLINHSNTQTWKNKFEIKSYRPISLLNTMVKILEKPKDIKLRWFLEKNNIFDSRQNGFWKHKSTSNTLHDIQEEIHLTLEAKQMMDLIALDITKAYDTTWHPRILKIMSNIIWNGNLFNFIKIFWRTEPFKWSASTNCQKHILNITAYPKGLYYQSCYFY